MKTMLIIRKIGFQSSLFVALAICCCGCTPLAEYVQNGFKVGPNYRKPDAAVASNWIDASDKRVRTEEDDLSKWWTVFNDPVLNDLVCDAYKQNLTLKEAGYRVLQARAQLGIAVGVSPVVGITGSLSPGNLTFGADSGEGLNPTVPTCKPPWRITTTCS